MIISKLEFRWIHRSGYGPDVLGVSKAERDSLDYVVDGQSLYELLDAEASDLVGGLGWMEPGFDHQVAAELLLDVPGSAPDGRRVLFVCPECGDIGCGALTVEIVRSRGGILWRRFGHENNYEPTMADFAKYKHVGPFVFNEEQYRSSIAAAKMLRYQDRRM